MSITICVQGHEEIELNMANDNAYAMLGALQLPQEPCGEITADKVTLIASRIFLLLNTERKNEIETPNIHEGNYHMMGRDKEYVLDRLERLQHIFHQAKSHGVGVIWY